MLWFIYCQKYSIANLLSISEYSAFCHSYQINKYNVFDEKRDVRMKRPKIKFTHMYII